MENKILAIYAESQIHAGKGSDVGIVDQPIQREKATGFPIIQGIKGAIRASKLINERESEVFGNKPQAEKEDLAGSVVFSEAKILAFPVRSPEAVFVWITCPMVLARLYRVKKISGVTIPSIGENKAIVSNSAMLANGKLSLEEIEIEAAVNPEATKWATALSGLTPDNTMKDHLELNFAIVSDKVFQSLVTTATEVIPRIRVDEKTGTVAPGALWYEEYLPQDTILYCILRNASVTGENLLNSTVKALDGQMITIGGNETVGKGLVYLKVMGG